MSALMLIGFLSNQLLNGNGTVTITASLNSTGADRTGTITVRRDNGTLEKKVRVTQGTPTGAIVPTINDNQYPE